MKAFLTLLGLCLLNGLLLAANPTAAELQNLKETKAKAEKGDVIEQYRLGLWYGAGVHGLKHNAYEAEIWLRKADAQGHPRAALTLGEMWTGGLYGTYDDAKAAWWMRKAAEQGHPRAQYNLGFMYAKGQGVLVDVQEAYKWFLLAEVQGGNAVGRALIERGLTPSQRAEGQRRAREWMWMFSYQRQK